MTPVSSTLYHIGPGEVSGLEYILEHVDASGNPKNLQPDYYVVIKDEGHSPWSSGDDGAFKAAAHLLIVSGDPFGTGELDTTTSGHQLKFARSVATGDWTGTIEIVECYDSSDADGFSLLDVKIIPWTPGNVSAITTSEVSAWTDIGQVVCHAGGASIDSNQDYRTRSTGLGSKAWPIDDAGTPKISIERNLVQVNGVPITSTQHDVEYVIEYNSNYTIQVVDLDLSLSSGSAYPDWDTISITSVERKSTIVYPRIWCEGSECAGFTHLDRPVVLGDGSSTLTNEDELSTSLYTSGFGMSGKIYLISNPNIRVANFTYDNLLGRSDLSATAAIVGGVPETYVTSGNIDRVHGSRSFSIRNILHPNSTDPTQGWPAQLTTVRPTDVSTILVERINGAIGMWPTTEDGGILSTHVQLVDWTGITGGDSDNLSAEESSVVVSRENYIPASTEEDVTVTVNVKDVNGIPIESILVEISTNLGILTPTSGLTDTTGNISFTLNSSAIGTATLEVIAYQETSGSITIDAPTVTFVQVPTNYGKRVSTNVNAITDYAEGQPFIDIFKAARNPNIGAGTWDDPSLEDLDASGFQMSCAPGQELNYVLRTNGTGSYAPGNYVLYYSGGGFTNDKPSEIYVPASLGVTPISNEDGEINFAWDGSSFLTFRIRPSTASMTPSNYVYGISCFHVDDVPGYNHDVQPFRQKFIDSLEGVNVIRYMNVTQTNNNAVSSWEERAKVTDSNVNTFKYDHDYGPTTRRQKGAPWEYVIEMSNQVSADAWICCPQRADDNYVSSLATLFRDNLRSDLRVFIEYSNEAWNWLFTAANYCNDVLRPQYGLPDSGVNWLKAYATRSCEIFAIFDEIFAEAPHRVKKVIAGQAANPARVTDILTTDVSIGTTLTGTAVEHTDYYAIAPYAGNTVDEATAQAAYDEMVHHFSSTVFNSGGSLEQNVNNLAALSTDVTLIGYEGGQHLDAKPQGVQTWEVVRDANRLPAMRGFHKDYMDGWDNLTGSGIMSIYSHVWQPGSSGAWGLLETLDDYGELPAHEGNYKWWGWNDWRDTLVSRLSPVNDAFAVRNIGTLLSRNPRGIRG